jgi:glycosyltransferase involved in cell wall biosynthesis
VRILAVVYACEPDRGSEPGVGWHFVRALAREHEVVALTRANNREVIERAQARGEARDVRFLYCDAPSWARFYKRGNRGVHLYQAQWQAQGFAMALAEHRRRPFDLVHHITFSASWYPSLFGLFPAPFMWGPVACNEPVPPSLAAHLLSPAERARNTARGWLNGPLSLANPLIRVARARAVRILAVNGDVAARVGGAKNPRVVVFPAIGADDPAGGGAGDAVAVSREASPAGALRAVLVGRLIGLKGFVLALHALASLPEELDVSYEIVGDGPQRAELEALAARLGIADRVQFLGALPHAETVAAVRRAEAMVFPAFDAGGMVVIEALATGLPVICLDTAGPGESVTTECGFAVPVGSFEETVAGLAAGLAELARAPALRERQGRAARARFLASYEWGQKGERLLELVRGLPVGGAARPRG